LEWRRSRLPAGEIEQQLIQRFGTAETMRRRIDRYMAEGSPMAAAARQAILPLLPKNPRMAKRLVSQLRLMLVIAYGRGLLDDTSPVTAGHVAKWVVFADRWPALVNQLTRRPAQLQCLESASADEFAGAVGGLSDRVDSVDELYEFLHTGILLGTSVEQLLHVAPELTT